MVPNLMMRTRHGVGWGQGGGGVNTVKPSREVTNQRRPYGLTLLFTKLAGDQNKTHRVRGSERWRGRWGPGADARVSFDAAGYGTAEGNEGLTFLLYRM